MYYEAYFSLTSPVNDLDKANDYLQEDKMVVYLLNNYPELEKKVEDVKWVLDTTQRGRVIVTTCNNQELEIDEMQKISKWISGQNSDGLGEGFSQQDFAIQNDGEDRDNCDWGDYYDSGCCTYANFDWETNDYNLEKVND